jgi:hypothetical protein
MTLQRLHGQAQVLSGRQGNNSITNDSYDEDEDEQRASETTWRSLLNPMFKSRMLVVRESFKDFTEKLYATSTEKDSACLKHVLSLRDELYSCVLSVSRTPIFE